MNEEEGITKDIVQTLPILVSDADGKKLDVDLNPSEVTVNIPVNPTSKEIPLVLNQTGTANDGFTYELGLNNQTDTDVSVQANNEVLKNLSSYPVDVDVTDITKTITQTIELPLIEGVTLVDPKEIEVTITVTKKIQ